MGIYPETNALAAALWERIDRTSRQSVCPCDDLIELIPDFDPTPVSSLTLESCGRGSAAVGPAGYVLAGRCATEDARESRAAASGPRSLAGALQSNIHPAGPLFAYQRNAATSEPPALPAPGPERSQRPTEAPADLVAPANMPNFSGGYDGGCEVSYYGEWFDGNLAERKEFFEELGEYKARAAESYDRCSDPLPEIVFLNGQPWIIAPTGTGGRGGKPRFRFRLQRGGVTLLIHNNPKDKYPAVRARFGYEALFGRDLVDVNNEVRELLNVIGLDVTKEILGRVDMQVTLATKFDWVAKAFDEGRIVARVRQWNRWDRNVDDGLTLQSLRGGSTLQVAIYDKLKECLDKRDEQKLEDLNPLFDGADEYGLTRIEFRFKREALNYFDLQTVEDFAERMPDVVDYVTRRWFRILKTPKVRGRENKQDVSQEWEWVQFAFESAFCQGRKSSVPLTRDRSKRIDKRLLVKQALGCLSSATAYDNEVSTMTLDEFQIYVLQAVNDAIPELYKDYLRKRADYNITKNGECDVPERELLATADESRPYERIPF
ncbi:MAG: hypothetical protein IJ387_12110 [Thermoguttaceae bacterium]|nr:hypothetical protein [Thermoguttaceae bacterium]